jgi:hypothetical protein
MRLSATKLAAIGQSSGFGNQLYDFAGQVPSLDQRFADDKSLTDAVSGQQLITHTRASSGTYVDSTGVLRSATTNLLLRSEDLTTTWTKDAGVTITADSSQGQPFSAAQVFRVNYTGANQAGPIQGTAYLAAPYAASVWIKGTPGETIRFTGQTTVAAADFALTGNWQRLSLTWTGTAASNAFTLNTFNAVTARTIYVAAPQLEQSATVGEYIPTTSTINSAPRFDHDPATGESLGLLREEQGTNLLQYSQDITDVAWAKSNATVTKETLAGPAGTVPYDKITLGTFTGTYGGADRNPVSTSPSVFYTASVYAKAGTCRYIGLTSRNYDSNGWGTYFDLQTGVVTQNRSSTTYSILSVGGGWYRLSIGKDVGLGGSSPGFSIIPLTVAIPTNGPSNNIEPQYNGNGEYLYAWAPQYEAGAFPTSYIPTTTVAVTRSADVASITGSAFSGWYNAAEGTVFDEYIIPALGNGTITSFDDGTANNRWQQRFTATNHRLRIQSGGVSLVDQTGAGPPQLNIANKAAYALKSGDQFFTANGSLGVARSEAPLPSVTQLQFATGPATDVLGRTTIRRVTYWPTRLSNEVLQRITQ